jgi:hypothetical protein
VARRGARPFACLSAILGFLDDPEAKLGQMGAHRADHRLVVIQDEDWHGQVNGHVPGLPIACYRQKVWMKANS